MIFAHFLIDVNEANSFLVASEETGDALLIDVAQWDPRIPAFLQARQLTLDAIFISHDHFDHTGGLAEAVETTGATVYAGKGHVGGCPARHVHHGETLQLGALEGRVLETPGHTPESISLVVEQLVFSGDALFAGSVGGTHSKGHAARQIQAIRDHILSLPGDFSIHPGHGPSSTVAVERHYNPFFQD